jgi:hypothetical protein
MSPARIWGVFNPASTGVYGRDDQTSAITITSDYRSEPADFAITVRSETVAHLCQHTAPRLVEQPDQAPCNPIVPEAEVVGAAPDGASKAGTPEGFVTRLHIRHAQDVSFEELKFGVTKDRANFRCRHGMTPSFEGEIPCEAGEAYVAATRQRLRGEAATLPRLTRRRASNIADTIAKTVPRRYRSGA